ncbi:hypothetical protein Cgig2_021710 [Carnegiea gigantea]|uniref:Uncharacterized protein n=1 Tax=Carnegiea gigantea TaxID=171969 RepID=A0A9Q1GMQ6_9CARY|nr:hypothetical protein Cgig2_021710 [Carnegiea gigantea]
MEWLDRKRVEGKPVLYVAFGSQAEISNEQLKEIIIGLEKLEVDFLWALRIKPDQERVIKGFEEKVKARGLVVREWIAQSEALEHESVQGVLSHCGWNSVTESICIGVPILAWPMMAEQHLNAKMVSKEIKVGLRVETCDGSVRGKMVKELMGGEMGKMVHQRVKELSEAAKKAVKKAGTSWHNLESLLNELGMKQTVNYNNNRNESLNS